jgi:hypothetical protein
MTTTTALPEYETEPWPGYETPIPLREALDNGTYELGDLFLPDLHQLIAGELVGDRAEHSVAIWRAYVDAALSQDPRYCPPFREAEGQPYVRRWPSQKDLNQYQWGADLVSEPDLLPRVLETLTSEERAEVDSEVELLRFEARMENCDWNEILRPLPFNVRRIIFGIAEMPHHRYMRDD